MIIQNVSESEIVGFREYRKTATIQAVRMKYVFTVDTLEGRMEGKPGDWLAVGVEGERYIIDHAIFCKSYERC